MRSDDILDQIDHALEDWTVSGDAMRSQPAPNPQPDAGPRMWIAPAGIGPDESGWEEVGHVTSIDFHIEPPVVDPELQRSWQEFLARVEADRVRRAVEAMSAVMRAYAQAVKPAVERAVAQIQEAMQHLDPPLPPGRRHDRPAWQSPYGPPRRRR